MPRNTPRPRGTGRLAVRPRFVPALEALEDRVVPSSVAAAFDPASATWHLPNSLSTGPADLVFSFGGLNKVPVVGDWDGDGQVGVGVYNPSNGKWQLRNSLSTGPADITFIFGVGIVPIV